MGLDIYAGTLTRYYAHNWKSAVQQWAEANGYAFGGPFFNIYHVSPRETRDPDAFVTEVCYPVRKR